MFPYEMVEVKGEDAARLKAAYKGEPEGFCKVGPPGWFFPLSFMEQAQGYRDMPPRPDDVWIITFPRSGTTITQEIVYLLVNDLDYKKANQSVLYDRVPFYEYSILHTSKKHAQLENVDDEQAAALAYARIPGYLTLVDAPDPRLIKTHLPPSLLHPDLLSTSKIIYLARQPKDVAVSYFHLNLLIKFFDFSGDFKDFWNLFQRGEIVHGPYWEHIKEGWEIRNQPNVKFVFYEDLIKNMKKTIGDIASFLGKSYTDEQINGLMKHVEINNFRKNVQIRRDKLMDGLMNKNGSFIRKGEVGNNSELDDELDKEADKWIQQHQKSIGIKFTDQS